MHTVNINKFNKEALALARILSPGVDLSLVVEINDRDYIYPGKHPRTRILKALEYVKKQQRQTFRATKRSEE